MHTATASSFSDANRTKKKKRKQIPKLVSIINFYVLCVYIIYGFVGSIELNEKLDSMCTYKSGNEFLPDKKYTPYYLKP